MTTPSEKAQETTRTNYFLRGMKGREYAIRDLQEIVVEWLRTYVDEYGRGWRQLKNPSHSFSRCWKDCTAMLDARGQTYVDGDLRAAIKGAVSCLAGEAAAQAEAQHAENMRQVEQGFGLAGGLLALLNKHFGDE